MRWGTSGGRMARTVAASGLLLGLVAAMPRIAMAQQQTNPQTSQQTTFAELVSGVVRVKTFIDPDGSTLKNLGREREGSGIVIDDNGLVLTIGYIMVEAYTAEVRTNDGKTLPANIVGYDAESGLGLIQAIAPLKVRPLPIGNAADLKEGDIAIVAGYGGESGASGMATVVSKREFAADWEYLLDQAIFTSPPFPNWAGSALISREGKLIGVGSLALGDVAGKGEARPGNMFVPAELITPILGDLLANGASGAPPVPWLGMATSEAHGRLIVGRVTEDGPAAKAGIKKGDIISGIDGRAVPDSLGSFYRVLRSLGPAGVRVPLDVGEGSDKRRVEVISINRRDMLKLKGTF